jgi:sugar/nucleoside kinase (ribokinase family)
MLTSLGASASFGVADLSEELIIRADWLYIEGYKFSQNSSSEAVFKAIEIAKKFNTKISLTFSDAFITENYRDIISDCLKHSDLIFCNEGEALNFTQTANIGEATKKLEALVDNFAITRGKKGALIKWNNKIIEIPPYPANPVDSTGAGDIFAAGFFYGIIKYNDAQLAGKLGAYAGAKIVSQIGPRLKENHSKIVDLFLD